MKNVKIVLLLIVMLVVANGSSIATTLDSSAFPYKYEANVLPSAFGPYVYSSGNGTAESSYASISDGIMTMDTDSDGQDSDSGWWTLAGGAGTSWNPHFLGGYTMEIRMKSFANNSGAYNAWFQWYDENSAILLQVWHNKVYLNNVVVADMDNQTDFHTFRIVANVYDSSAGQKFDLYRDGVLIIDDAPNFPEYPGSKFRFGDMTGFEESKVAVDYIRWDDKNAWAPIVPEPTTMILLGIGGLVLSVRRK
ncbi:MAG: hypothetical protein A2Y12_00450 [Planctomycetes bacterium GWF2_42_9]|nr:MAG: hypothetical protein A2Y12_00450 [Planctomycetes bacterium GWF2_42_9]